MALTYGEYLKIPELLTLQRPRSEGPEHDEMLFIVIHQVYELWFKQMLHEAGYLQEALEANRISQAVATFKRMLTILKTLVAQVDVLETMTPVSFTSFRDRLGSASGFQSVQFREFEFVLGYKRKAMCAHLPEGSPERTQLEARLQSRSLYASFLSFLSARGYAVPSELLEHDVTQPHPSSLALQQELIRVYRTDPEVTQVCERLVDLDEGLQEWRYRHVKMVERTIGFKVGTGGSSGAEYLRQTLFKPLFPDLWTIRASL